MQAGEVIWLFAGIGIGLTGAMLILAAVLAVDGQRVKRKLASAAAPDEFARRPAAVPKAAVPRSLAPLSEPRPRSVPPPVAAVPPPPPKALEPIVADPKAVEPAGIVVEEMMSDLAAEIARMQSTETVTVELEPAPEPIKVIAEPAATPLPEVSAAPEPPLVPVVEVAAAAPVPAETVVVEDPAPPPLVLAPVLPPVPPPPKVPPLPKVTPARKFAPALPPRNPPAKS